MMEAVCGVEGAEGAGLREMAAGAGWGERLGAALAGGDRRARADLMELLAALCAHSARGYARVLLALQHAAVLARRPEGSALAAVVEELRDARGWGERAAALALSNCLLAAAPNTTQRNHAHTQLIELGILPVLDTLRVECEVAVRRGGEEGEGARALQQQLLIWREAAGGRGGDVELTSPRSVFEAVMRRATLEPAHTALLHILQHLLRLEPDGPLTALAWRTADTLVLRAVSIARPLDAERLLHHQSSVCTCASGRKLSLQRALSPPPAPSAPSPPTTESSADTLVALPPPPPPPLQSAPPPPAPALTPTPHAPSPCPDVVLPQQETPIPKTKMKTINWNKIPKSKVVGGDNVWWRLGQRARTTTTTLDWSEMEGLFCQQGVGVSGGCGSGSSSPRAARARSEVTLLDPKRSLNVNIFLKQFRSSHEGIVSLVSAGGEVGSEALGAERLRALLVALPDAAEVAALLAYRGDPARLAHAEAFLHKLIQLPEYRLRIECMCLRAEWESAAGWAAQALGSALLAGGALLTSEALREVLYLALTAGNFLNAGGYAGGAAGVRLPELLKLADIRANKPGLTLMHYVAQQAERKDPALTAWAADTKLLEEAARAPHDQLRGEVGALARRVHSLRRQLDASSPALQDQYADFLRDAAGEVAGLQGHVDDVERMRLALAEFFCEDPNTFKLDDCFKTFATFMGKFRAAVADNARRRRCEEAAAARRAAASAALNLSVPVDGTSVDVGTPGSDGESLMEALLAEPARRKHSPSPDGGMRRRSARDDEAAVLEFLRRAERSTAGSLDRSWARRGVRARTPLPHTAPPSRDREPPASPAPQTTHEDAPKPKEWRQKIESWLRANSEEEHRERQRAIPSTVTTAFPHRIRLTPIGNGEWKDTSPGESSSPPPPPSPGLVPLHAIAEDVPPAAPDVTVTADAPADIDSDNVETPPAQRKYFTPPPERELCRRFQPSLSARLHASDRASTEMKDLCQEILGDGQFDRHSAARRTRRYKKSAECGSPEEDKKPETPVELRAETQVIRPTKLDVQVSYPVDAEQVAVEPSNTAEDKDYRLKRWQDRVKGQNNDRSAPKDKHPFSKMRRQTSINKEDVQKAIRELKSPTEPPTAVWSRNAHKKPAAERPAQTADPPRAPPVSSVSSSGAEHELQDEGFEETQSLNSESASQGASSDSPAPPPARPASTPAPTRPPLRPPAGTLAAQRSPSRASLQSSRSSLTSQQSVVTVRRGAPPARAGPREAPPALRSGVPRAPQSRPSSARGPRTSGFMRPTQASRGRHTAAPAARGPHK